MLSEATAYAELHQVPLLGFTGSPDPSQSYMFTECNMSYIAECCKCVVGHLTADLKAEVIEEFSRGMKAPRKSRKAPRKPAPKKPKFSLFWGLYTRY